MSRHPALSGALFAFLAASALARDIRELGARALHHQRLLRASLSAAMYVVQLVALDRSVRLTSVGPVLVRKAVN